MQSVPFSIADVDLQFERQPLVKPFGFKGGYIRDVWHSAVSVHSGSGKRGYGLGVQSVLWSDAAVFAGHTEVGGNALMFACTEFALQQLKDKTFTDPMHALDFLLDPVHQYACTLTQRQTLRKTFTLNALVAVDNALWQLYAHEHDVQTFDELIPAPYQPALSYRHDAVASIPIVSYNTPDSELLDMLDEGYFFFKFKLGAPGSQEEMLVSDIKRFERFHRILEDRSTPHTESGRLPYYLDANGRYESLDTLKRFLDAADRIDGLHQIALIEEPFPESNQEEVGHLGVRIAADESAHTDEDARRRIDQGYGAIALKPIAKTMSMTLRIARVAYESNTPCFCADLTVNPILVDWNKSFAARLNPLPGFHIGLMETNGHQNYQHWEQMQAHHPLPDASWITAENGVFHLDNTFYDKSGGILMPSPHVEGLFAL